MRQEQILDSILDAGECLLTAGAEVSRVEDTIRRMAKAYGFVRTDVLTITSCVIVTAHTEQGDILTQTRRILKRSTDMRRIQAVNALSRSVCAQPVPLEELRARLREIEQTTDSPVWLVLLSYLMIASSFAVFFGGSLRDGIAAALCSAVLFAIDRMGTEIWLQPMILTIFSAAVQCFCAFLTVWIGLGQSVDCIVIGNIMLLIPGVALITALRDMITGDIISGLLGLCEAILRALAIAAGCALVLMKFGGSI